MNRARMAKLTLAGSLLLTPGCFSLNHNECESGGLCSGSSWFSRFRLTSRTSTSTQPCDCEGGVPMSTDGSVIVPPNAGVPPGAFVAPPGTIVTPPGAVGQPPRISPIPQQASPMPYTPPN